MARRRLLIAVLAAAALVALAVFGLASNRSSPAGRAAPALPRELLAGPPVTIAGLRAAAGGHPALVVFWASWCEPCRSEAPAVERLARSPAGRGRVVGVDWSDADQSARGFIKKYGWSFSNLRDGGGEAGLSYGLRNLPTTFVIGAGGRIEKTLLGPQTEQSLGRALVGSS
ncbi:MAG TPA: TlpA disulfide reductase family protein [Solirubrobacteraceae bacterium]|nr:TlpA disulfide reductase family protein [Solirubrobacteraceae bacterium]